MRCLPTIAFLLLSSTMIQASDPLVFVSAFASGEKGAIHTFRFDQATGRLSPVSRASDVEHPFFLAVSPDGRFLYSIDADKFGGDDDERVAAFSIDRKTGGLKRLNAQSSRGRASCYLDVDKTGKAAVVANYSSGDIAALPINEDGSFGKAASYIRHTGSSVNPKRQQAPYAHCLEISPDNRFALAADLGIDKVLIYRLDAAIAKLAPNSAQAFATVEPGSGPRHVTFHPNGKRVYVINELKNTVSFFDYGPKDGTLSHRQTIPTLPPDFDGTSHTADLKITPNGKFLYGTNRGHDSIAIYRIADDGTLSLVNITPSLGKGPQNLLITPDGRWLLCANMPGNNVVVFKIDAETGELSPNGEPVSVPMASCIRWLPSMQ